MAHAAAVHVGVGGRARRRRVFLPELLPSSLTGMADTPFDEFDAAQLAVLGRWLERAAPRWPMRRSRRTRAGRRGESIAMRATMAASGRAGFEPLLDLRRQRRVLRPRPLTLVTDVSASMQSYSAAYLHLMRAFARTGRAETFAFSTSLTRLTPALVHRSADTALALAEERVVDRYGGTHLAGSLRDLLASRHGSTLRGGVLVIASDGWDTDEPASWPSDGAAAATGPAAGVAEPARRGGRVRSRWSGRWRRRCRSATRSCRRTRSTALPDVFAATSAPQGDVHGRAEPADAGALAAEHRLGGARRAHEPDQLGRGRDLLVAGQGPGRPGAAAGELGCVDAHQPAVAEVLADREGRARRRGPCRAGSRRGQRRRSGRSAAASRGPSAGCSTAEVSPAGSVAPGSEVPDLVAEAGRAAPCPARPGARARRRPPPRSRGTSAAPGRAACACRAGPSATSTRAGEQQVGEVGDRVHAQLDVEVARAAGEQADQPGCGVLGEEVTTTRAAASAARRRPR